MCLAVPAKVVEIEAGKAEVESMGVRRSANLSLVEDVKVGDYILLHAGFAIEKLEPQDAEETLGIFTEILEQQGE